MIRITIPSVSCRGLTIDSDSDESDLANEKSNGKRSHALNTEGLRIMFMTLVISWFITFEDKNKNITER